MPTNLDLIKSEQFANVLFIISTLYAFASGDQAAQNELVKQQSTSSSGSTSYAEKSAQSALSSTLFAAGAYVIYILVGVIREKKLEQGLLSGTSKTPVMPSVIIVLGFIITLIGTLIRIPAIQQRINEARAEVIL